MTILHDRALRTTSVLERFREKPFSWVTTANCIHLGRAQLVAFDYAPPPIPMFRSPIGARRALRKRGFDTMAALLDTMLAPIAPASMLLGDFALLPGLAPFQALGIYDGHGSVMCWHDIDLSRMLAIEVRKTDVLRAWRV